MSFLIFTDSGVHGRDFASAWKAKGYAVARLPILLASEIPVAKTYVADRAYGAIVTSSNAIRALTKFFSDRDTPVYTISPLLAEKIAAKRYREVLFESNGENATSLAATFKKHPPKGELLHLRGERVRSPIVDVGVSVSSLPVYRMLAVRANVERLKRALSHAKDALAYVSSEQAIETLLSREVSVDRLVFRSEYLKTFALDMAKALRA